MGTIDCHRVDVTAASARGGPFFRDLRVLLQAFPSAAVARGGRLKVEETSGRAVLVEDFNDKDKHHLLDLGNRDITRH